MTSMSITVSEYTNKVLGVIKEKFGLKDKAQALDKFTEMYGEEFVEREVKDGVVQEVINSCEKHIKRYGHRKMSLKELDNLCGIE